MSLKPTINFILAGVGGQGTILASDLLAEVGLEAGYDAKQAEVHGMAQRGGSVSSHVRWGRVIHSPLVAVGDADFLIAFEQVEAVRVASYLRPRGVALVNLQAIAPVTVTAGPAIYPPLDHLKSELERFTDQAHWVPAHDVAKALGNDKVANVVMLGALSVLLEKHLTALPQIPPRLWLKVLECRVPARYLQLNRLAFQQGRDLLLASELDLRPTRAMAIA